MGEAIKLLRDFLYEEEIKYMEINGTIIFSMEVIDDSDEPWQFMIRGSLNMLTMRVKMFQFPQKMYFKMLEVCNEVNKHWGQSKFIVEKDDCYVRASAASFVSDMDDVGLFFFTNVQFMGEKYDEVFQELLW